MASLRKLPNSPYWIACFTNADGQRTNKSTKTSDRKQAQRIADEWEHAAKRARKGELIEAQARKVVNDILEKSGNDKMNSATVTGFMADWLDGKHNPRTQERYKHTADLFAAYLGNRAKQSIAKVTYKDVLGFIAGRRAAGMAEKTILVDAKTLNTAFRMAGRIGLVTENPVGRALALKPIKAAESQKHTFTATQVKALLKHADAEWQTVILIGFLTGARLSDCAGMTWGNVKLDKGVLDFIPRKTKKRVVVPLHPDLEKHLLTLPSSDTADSQLCPTLCELRTGGKTGLSESFKAIMLRAGIDPQMSEGNGKQKLAKLSFHSLRHSFNSILANEGIDQETRMALTGHSSVEVNNGYTHLELPKLKAAVQKLPSIL